MKRAFIIGFSIIVLIFVEIINWICLALDHVFFPGFRKVKIKPPLFITGMPRSATTLCFSLLVADSDTFTSMKLWEILFAPSIIQKKIFLIIKKIDSAFNHHLYKALSRFDKFFFKKIEDFHPVSLFNFEEDDFLFLHIFSTPSLIFLFPKNKRIISLQNFDEGQTRAQKRFLMRFYRNCVKRHLYVFGGNKRYLAKSPSHTPKIITLLDYFPDCQVVYMLRNPTGTIGSSLNLFRQVKIIFQSEINMDLIIIRTLSLADIYYKYPLVTCKPLLGKFIKIVAFKELTSGSSEAIQNIYEQFEIQMTDDFKNFLQTSEKIKGKHKTKSTYSLEEFGLTTDLIVNRYDFVYREYSDLL